MDHQPKSNSIIIRDVWSENLESEFDLISQLIDHYSFISMDTEFPGLVFRPQVGPAQMSSYICDRRPSDHYNILKSNIDALNLIQVDLILSDSDDNLPHLGTQNQFIWEFNFRDFDVALDLHAPDSIGLLRRQGVDFDRNKEEGIDSSRFVELMMSSGLVCNDSMSWVTFHSSCDFGCLVKILTRRCLPGALNERCLLLGKWWCCSVERVPDWKEQITIRGLVVSAVLGFQIS